MNSYAIAQAAVSGGEQRRSQDGIISYHSHCQWRDLCQKCISSSFSCRSRRLRMPFAPKVQRYLRRGSYVWNKVGAWWPLLDRRGNHDLVVIVGRTVFFLLMIDSYHSVGGGQSARRPSTVAHIMCRVAERYALANTVHVGILPPTVLGMLASTSTLIGPYPLLLTSPSD